MILECNYSNCYKEFLNDGNDKLIICGFNLKAFVANAIGMINAFSIPDFVITI